MLCFLDSCGSDKRIMDLLVYTKHFLPKQNYEDVISDSKKHASVAIDFVTEKNALYRFAINILPKTKDSYTEEDVNISICHTPIFAWDNYEICARRLDDVEWHKSRT